MAVPLTAPNKAAGRATELCGARASEPGDATNRPWLASCPRCLVMLALQVELAET